MAVQFGLWSLVSLAQADPPDIPQTAAIWNTPDYKPSFIDEQAWYLNKRLDDVILAMAIFREDDFWKQPYTNYMGVKKNWAEQLPNLEPILINGLAPSPILQQAQPAYRSTIRTEVSYNLPRSSV